MESAMLNAQPNTNLNLISRLKSIFVTNYINLRGKSDRLDFLIVFLIAKGLFALALFVQYQVFLSAITTTNTNGYSGMVSIARVVTVFIWAILLIPLVTCTATSNRPIFIAAPMGAPFSLTLAQRVWPWVSVAAMSPASFPRAIPQSSNIS